MQAIKTADWSDEVAPFWNAVIRSALTTRGLAGLFKAGWTTLKVCSLSSLACAACSAVCSCPSCGRLWQDLISLPQLALSRSLPCCL